MANSLVNIVTQIFGSQMITRIATSLGISPALAQTLANAAIPAVLASLGNLASTRTGADKIAAQIQNQDSNILGSLVNSLGGANQASFLNSGSGMLSSLLGGGAASSISNALAKFTGAEPAQAQSMLGVVTPATFGALAQQDPAIWSSGDGISNLFKREQSAITSALPGGLATALGAAGLLNNLPGFGSASAAVSDAAASASATASRAAHEVGNAASRAGSTISSAANRAEREAEAAASGMPGWLKIAIPVAILAALAWFMMPASTPPAPAPKPAATAPAPTPAAPPPAAQTQPNTATQAAAQLAEFAQKTNATIAAIGSSLAGITNADQARAAQPAIEKAVADLDTLAGSFSNLPADARTALVGPMQASLGTVNTQVGRVQQIPGVDFLKPILDRIGTAIARFK